MSEAKYHHPEAIVSTDWLAGHLADPGLRIYEVTMQLLPPDMPDRPYRVENGREFYDAGHIPGAALIDIQAELSDNSSALNFTMPAPQALADALARRGVGEGNRVVLYARNGMAWATRVWWMMRAIGFDDAAILDGGWEKWCAEGRPVSTERDDYPAATLTAEPRAGLFVGKDEVLAAIGAPAICTINALAPGAHMGEEGRYGRRGRIPGSINVPAASLVSTGTLEFPSPEKAARAFADVGADPDKKIITYCGGGIAASVDAFLLHQLGFKDISIYDNSMSEWAKDESLPIEVG